LASAKETKNPMTVLPLRDRRIVATNDIVARRHGALYVRQSKTRDASESRTDQVAAGRATAARFDIDIAQELIEPPSTSGYKNRGRDRPEWRELLELLRNGEVDCVVVYTTARLSRGGIPSYAELFDAAEKGGLDVDHLVLTGEGWKNELEISIRASMDREDSKQKAKYSRDLHAKLALEGRFKGGRRPFGFEANGVTHRPAEVALIVDAAERHAAGETYAAIAADWMRRGIVSGRGVRFTPTGLAKMLRSDRLVGYRIHNGQRTKAAWEPILTGELAAAVQDRRPSDRARTRVNLLLGFLQCGRCGAPLRADNQKYYRCARPLYGGCGGIKVSTPAVDTEVFSRLVAVVGNAGLASARADGSKSSALQADVDELEARLEEGAQLWASGQISAGEWVAARQAVEDRLAAARRRLVRAEGRVEALAWVGRAGELAEYWAAESTTLEQRRKILSGWVEAITVGPSTLPPGTPRFDPARVMVEWRA
jgi:site-specific DNA recombinase